jgi:hypothetical protein
MQQEHSQSRARQAVERLRSEATETDAPDHAASGMQQAQMDSVGDETVERFVAKRPEKCLQKFSGFIS